MNIESIIILFIVGIIAGFINVGAGGGSSLTLPALIFIGLDAAIANGTNRIALIIQNIFAIWGFNQEKQNEFKISIKYALFTLPGAIIGAFLSIKIEDDSFKMILGFIMILIVFTMFIPKPENGARISTIRKPWILYSGLVLIGFYGGFIQVGVGFIIMAVLFHIAGHTLIKVNVHKVFIILIYTIPALIVFAISGNVSWKYGIILAVGNGLGGWMSAIVSVKKGEKYIKIALSAALIIIAYKLVF